MTAYWFAIPVILLAVCVVGWLVLEDIVNHIMMVRISRLSYELGRAVVISAGSSTDGPWDGLSSNVRQAYTSMAYSVFRQQPNPVARHAMTVQQQAVYSIMQIFFAESARIRGLKRT